MTSFFLIKGLHLLAAALYAGASFVNGLQEVRAQRDRDPARLAAAFHFAGINNRVFLLPATGVLVGTGVAMAWLRDVSLLRGWVAAPLLLFAGLTLLLVVSLRIEDRLAALAEAAWRDGTPLDERFHRLARIAFAMGGAASLAILVMFSWMVTRGGFP